MKIDQTRAIRALQEKIKFDRASSARTPMATGLKLTKSDCPLHVDEQQKAMQTMYRSHLMSLNYIARWTMPQITYAVSKLGKFMANPGQVHYKALKRRLKGCYASSSAEPTEVCSTPPSKQKRSKSTVIGIRRTPTTWTLEGPPWVMFFTTVVVQFHSPRN